MKRNVRMLAFGAFLLLAGGAALAYPLLVGSSHLTPTGATGPTDHPGLWESVPFVPSDPIHSALLPDGRVLMWGLDERTYLFDPLTRSFSAVIRSNTNLFCAGLAMLPDGRLFVAGGTAGFDAAQGGWFGLASAEIFDPATQRWTRVPDMPGGPRWYPTQITLPDGRVAVFTGTHRGVINPNIDVYDPVTNTWSDGGDLTVPMYARAHVMPDGKVLLLSTPDQASYVWDPATQAVTRATDQLVGWRLSVDQIATATGGSALLDSATGELLLFGGPGGTWQARSTERFNYATNTWAWGPILGSERAWVTPVIMPDGDVLAVGGDIDIYRGAPIPAEWYDVATGTWIPVAAPHYRHPYHSTALLLPDGSVLATNQEQHVVEVYHPWYAFATHRPVLGHAPNAVKYGDVFRIDTPDAATVARAVLLRIGGNTHGLNTDQRLVEVPITPGARSLTATAPVSPSIAPPGYYLLFILDAQGVPSEGRMIRLGVTVPGELLPGATMADPDPAHDAHRFSAP